jgi:mRNA interferase MazF
VIVSSDGINQSTRTWLLGAPISSEDPQDVLAVQVKGYGWVSAGNVTCLYRGWLCERGGEFDAPTAEQLNSTLRAAFGL